MRRWIVISLCFVLLVAQGLAMAEPVSFRIGTQFTDRDWWVHAFEQFGKEVGARIELSYIEWGSVGMEKFLTETAGGLTYDVVNMDSRWLAAVKAKGLVLPLDPYIQRDNFPIKDFFTPLIAALSDGQGIWGMPNDIDQYVPFFNLDMWDAAGLPYPEANWTWQEYEALMKRLTRIDPEGAATVFGGNGLLWPVVAYSFGAFVITGDGRFDLDKEQVVSGLQWSFDLRNVAHVFPRSSAEVGDVTNHGRLPAGKVAAHWAGAWYATSGHMRDTNVRWGVLMPPLGPAGRATEAFVGGWFIPSTSKRPDLSWQFMKFLHRDDVQLSHYTTFSGVPGRRSIASKPSLYAWQAFGKWSSVILDTVPHARAAPFHPLTDRVWEEIDNGLDAAAYGSESAKAGIDKLRPIVAAVLAEGMTK